MRKSKGLRKIRNPKLEIRNKSKEWLSVGFADNCGACVLHAQDVVVEPGRRDARTTNLAESPRNKIGMTKTGF